MLRVFRLASLLLYNFLGRLLDLFLHLLDFGGDVFLGTFDHMFFFGDVVLVVVLDLGGFE